VRRNNQAFFGPDGRIRKFCFEYVTSSKHTEASSYWNLVDKWDFSMVTFSPSLNGIMDVAPFSLDRNTNVAIALVDSYKIPKD
jgi:hypothetical protein